MCEDPPSRMHRPLAWPWRARTALSGACASLRRRNPSKRHSFALKCLVLVTSACSCGRGTHAGVGVGVRFDTLWSGKFCIRGLVCAINRNARCPAGLVLWQVLELGCLPRTRLSARPGVELRGSPAGRLPLQAGCMPGCFPAPGSCFGPSPPAGTLTPSPWTVRVNRG